MKRRIGRLAILVALLLTLLGIGGRASLAIYHVDGNSMTPAISPGERVLVFRWNDPGVGDLVIAGDDRSLPGFVVKRVVAVGGQHVTIRDSALYVDGQRVDERYLANGVATICNGSTCNLTVPAGSVYLLGDNRQESFDSRVIGPVSVASIIGVVVTVL